MPRGFLTETAVAVFAIRGVPRASGRAAGRRSRPPLALLSFLESGSNFTATAARLNLHENSVRYRVERALEVRGRPLGDDRIDVELALIACRWLPGTCLGHSETGWAVPPGGPREG